MPLILTFGKLRQEENKFEPAELGSKTVSKTKAKHNGKAGVLYSSVLLLLTYAK